MSIQTQIVDLLRNLQKKHDLAYLFISHDLKVVKSLCDEIVVMKSGEIVERGAACQIFSSPKEQYMRDLLKAAFEVVGDNEPGSMRVVDDVVQRIIQ